MSVRDAGQSTADLTNVRGVDGRAIWPLPQGAKPSFVHPDDMVLFCQCYAAFQEDQADLDARVAAKFKEYNDLAAQRRAQEKCKATFVTSAERIADARVSVLTLRKEKVAQKLF